MQKKYIPQNIDWTMYPGQEGRYAASVLGLKDTK